MAPSRICYIHSRMQPLSIDCYSLIKRELDAGSRIVALIARADAPRSIADPLSLDERLHVLEASFPDAMRDGRLTAIPLEGFAYDTAAYAHGISSRLEEALGTKEQEGCNFFDGIPAPSEVSDLPSLAAISFTLHEQAPDLAWCSPSYDCEHLCEQVKALAEIRRNQKSSGVLAALHAEYESAADVRRRYGSGPFDTADAICICDGHALLIRRGKHPYKGLFAIPGGIAEGGEEATVNAARELLEETSLSHRDGQALTVDELLQMHPTKIGEFFNGWRDPRGRYRGRPVLFALPGSFADYMVEAADDAADVAWVSIDTVSRRKIAFDHYDILQIARDMMPEAMPHL